MRTTDPGAAAQSTRLAGPRRAPCCRLPAAPPPRRASSRSLAPGVPLEFPNERRILIGGQQTLVLPRVPRLENHQPALAVGVLVDQRRVVPALGVESRDGSREGGIDVGDGLGGLHL